MTKKRVLSLLTAFVLCISMLPMAAFAAGEEPAAEEIILEEESESASAETDEAPSEIISEESEESGEKISEEASENGVVSGQCDSISWTLDENGTLTVSGAGAIPNDFAKTYLTDVRSSITSVVVGDGITSVGETAFDHLSALQSVSLGRDVTDIQFGAFLSCGALKSAALSEGITTIANQAFFCCEALKSIELPSTVTSIGMYAFSGCVTMESVKLPAALTAVSSHTFDDCCSLKSVVIPEGVTSLGDAAFIHCGALESVKLPTTLTTIGEYAFAYCTKLGKISIPNSVTSFADFVFVDCDALTEVNLGSGVTAIAAHTFNGCYALKTLVLGKGISSIDNGAFSARTLPLLDSGMEIYYAGSQSDWSNIENNESENMSLAPFHIHYNTVISAAFSMDGHSESTASVSVVKNTAYGTLPTPADKYIPASTRVNYRFLGWFTEPAAGTQVTAETKVTAGENHTLYAHYGYNVTYDPNGGSGAPETDTATYGVEFTVSETEPVRDGYIFLGWSYLPDAARARYIPGESYDFVYGTLYAVWKAEDYTVSYHANGGSGAPENGTRTYGEAFTVSETEPVRKGYTFLGWSNSSDATQAKYIAGESYDSVPETLYAVWKVNTYTVTYNANGGKDGPGTGTKTYGEAFTVSETVPTRTGYSFLGWSNSKSAKTAAYLPGESYTSIYLNLYAVWQTNTYTVCYHANGGIGEPDNGTKVYAQSYTIPATVPSRTGYTFLGWSTSRSAAAARYLPGESYSFLSSFRLYAVWKANVSTVTFNPNGGKGGPGTALKTYGQSITIPETEPVRTGYTFLGWSNSPNATRAKYAAGESYTSIYLNLYAVWKANTYTVCYHANGGTGGPDNGTKIYAQSYTIPTVVPTRAGYTFLGWSNSKTAAAAKYLPGERYTSIYLSLYAVWQKNK